MSTEIINLFKSSYQDLIRMDLSKLDLLYAPNMVFKDPVHEIRGLAAMQDYTAEMCSNVNECRFEFLDQLQSENAAYIKWNMHYRHPRLAGGNLLTLRGISQIHFDQRIIYHEDVYDMGALVYEHVPVFGGVTRWLKGRLAS